MQNIFLINGDITKADVDAIVDGKRCPFGDEMLATWQNVFDN